MDEYLLLYIGRNIHTYIVFAYFFVFSELSSKLQDTLEMIEESLDVALSKTCNGFDEKHYEKVQTAYKLLGKTQVILIYGYYCYISAFLIHWL